MLALIVAVAYNNVIGKDNWRWPSDLKCVKERTMGHVIIMGRKTFESLPFLLPNREHWVITRDKGFNAPEGVRIFHNVDDIIKAAKELDLAYVIGGAQLYEVFFPVVDTLYVTEVDENFEGDAFFPLIDFNVFKETSRIAGPVDEKNKYKHDFVTYVRKDKA